MIRRGCSRPAALVAALALTLAASVVTAGTTGKISGRVIDAKKQPLVGANIAIPAARLGAQTDAEGRYAIIGIPAGSYEVKFSLIGYGPVAVQNVLVTSDNTTSLDMTLAEAPVLMKEVVVTARRPVVDLKLTSTLATMSRQDLKALPVQELQDVVNLQAGVVDGHFRGGRLGEVQYQVDGVTVNNPYDNSSSVRIDRSLIEEVQVVSGTFDAEYGQAMSGVVNAVLRRGGDSFAWDAEVFSGGFAYAAGRRAVPSGLHELRPMGSQNYQGSLSGPTGLPQTTFLLSARRSSFDDYLNGQRFFHPTDRTLTLGLPPSGDLEIVPLVYSREWSGLGKFSNRSVPHLELSYQLVGDLVTGRHLSGATWAFRFDPDGLSKQRTLSLVHGLDATYTLSKKTFVSSSLRQNYFDYKDMLYDDAYDARYDAAGPAMGVTSFADGAYLQGVDFARFRQKTSTIVWKSSVVSQMTSDHQVKLGAEFQWPRISFGKPGELTSTQLGNTPIVRRDIPDALGVPPPGVREYRPYQVAAFAQEDLEWNDLRIRGGLRLEYFNPRAGLPEDLENPANSIAGAPVRPYRAATRKVVLAPRLGVSYPITQDAALFFAYGHFYQMPSLGDIYQRADYTILRGLQSEAVNYDVMGNPDIQPEKTVQYQFGYKQAVTEWLGVDLNLFYKDIRDLLGVEFITTYNDAEYARMTNVDFGNVLGFTVTLEQRRRGLLSTSLDYTWETAQGNSSDPRETATRASAGQDPRPRQIPFNWDQRHTLNLTLMLSRPESFSVSTVVRVASGQPYTPSSGATGFFQVYGTNALRKPAGVIVDLRAEKNLRLAGVGANLFARAFNLLDSRYFNNAVFATTGSPYYSLNTADPTLRDPTRFHAPRRIEAGLSLSMGR